MPTKSTPAPARARRQSAAASSTIETNGLGKAPAKTTAAPKRAPRKAPVAKVAPVAEVVEATPAKAAPAKAAPAPKRSSRRPLTTEHKAALGAGREQGRVVRRYLETLERNRPKRGRRRTPESIKRQLVSVEERLAS